MNILAQTNSGQKLNVVFSNMLRIVTVSLDTTSEYFSSTWGMNEKAGMNAVKLDNYFIKENFPLYPDVEDVAKKSK